MKQKPRLSYFFFFLFYFCFCFSLFSSPLRRVVSIWLCVFALLFLYRFMCLLPFFDFVSHNNNKWHGVSSGPQSPHEKKNTINSNGNGGKEKHATNRFSPQIMHNFLFRVSSLHHTSIIIRCFLLFLPPTTDECYSHACIALGCIMCAVCTDRQPYSRSIMSRKAGRRAGNW